MERFGHDFIQAFQQHPALLVETICHRGSRSTSPLFSLLVIPRAFWQSRQVDVVHLGDPMLSLAGWLIKTIWRKKIAVTVHGLDITYPNAFYQIYLRLFLRSFDYYFPISAAVANCLQPFRVSGQAKVINPPLSVDYFDPSIKREQLYQLLGRYNLNQASPPALLAPAYLLTTGRLVTRKGPAESSLRHLIQTHHLNDRVHLLGRVSDDALRILYNTVDAYVQPNVPVKNDLEGFGLVVIEAAACQLPVFSAAVDGLPDAIIPGKNGQLLPPNNATAWQAALQPLIASPQPSPLARKFTLRHYTWSAYLRSWLDTLSNTATPHRR